MSRPNALNVWLLHGRLGDPEEAETLYGVFATEGDAAAHRDWLIDNTLDYLDEREAYESFFTFTHIVGSLGATVTSDGYNTFFSTDYTPGDSFRINGRLYVAALTHEEATSNWHEESEWEASNV